MSSFKNYYKVLEINVLSDMETIKAAYRKMARKYHPDLNGNNPAAEEKLKEINEAYQTLSNAEKKAVYDQTLKVMLNKSGMPPPRSAKEKSAEKPGDVSKQTAGKASPPPPQKKQKPEPSRPEPKPEPKSEKQKKPESAPTDDGASIPITELFESFLKQGQQARQEAAFKKERYQRGEDVTVETVLTPQEASEGIVKTVNVQHNEICRRCSGTGKLNGVVCQGCGGEKTLSRLKKIDVRIPPGVKDGSKVRVAKEGGKGLGGADNGDLFLAISISVDPLLRIDGLNVYCDLDISVLDAVLGAEKDIPTLNGTVKMTIPPLTSSGKVFRLKGLGALNGANRGDQFVTVSIKAPETLSPAERELYEQLARLKKI